MPRLAKSIRKQQGLGLRECARAAGIDPSSLLKFEEGERGLSIPSLQSLARTLHNTVDRLLQDAPDEVPA